MDIMSSKKSTKKSTKKKSTKKKTIPKEWKEDSKEVSKEVEKGKRRTLISTLKRSISIKSDKPESSITDPMNIVITLSPAKHLDIMEYIDENVAPGGRAEWVRDSIRLKMRIERGVYGLNTSGVEESKDTESLQAVFGQFAEVMTKVMTDLRDGQPAASSQAASSTPASRPRPPPAEPRPSRGGPPQLKKVVTDEKDKKEILPDRPSLDDAIGAIIIVE